MSFSFSPFRLLSPKNSSGPRPNRSNTPGLNGSMRTSAMEIISSRSFLPFASLESTMMDRLPRQRTSFEAAEGRSTRVTEAPLSARIRPANGPGARPANYRIWVRKLRHWKLGQRTSITFRPARAMVIERERRGTELALYFKPGSTVAC